MQKVSAANKVGYNIIDEIRIISSTDRTGPDSLYQPDTEGQVGDHKSLIVTHYDDVVGGYERVKLIRHFKRTRGDGD